MLQIQYNLKRNPNNSSLSPLPIYFKLVHGSQVSEFSLNVGAYKSIKHEKSGVSPLFFNASFYYLYPEERENI